MGIWRWDARSQFENLDKNFECSVGKNFESFIHAAKAADPLTETRAKLTMLLLSLCQRESLGPCIRSRSPSSDACIPSSIQGRPSGQHPEQSWRVEVMGLVRCVAYATAETGLHRTSH